MAKTTWMCAALTMTAALTLSAENFPLQFKTISAQNITNFPGSYGMATSLTSAKPSAVRKEPKAISRHPLYAQYRSSPDSENVLVRLDESQGDGKGYDQMLVDANHNGDLTDDTVVARVSVTKERAEMTSAIFGPITLAADKRIAGGEPVYYAQTYFYSLPASVTSARGSFPAGMVRLKAGWYLETTVALNGVKQKVGAYDADGSLQLGDPPKSQILRSSGADSGWTFSRGDIWLVDANGSGAFEEDAFQSEAVPCSSLLYLGSKPFKVSLAADCQALAVEPWSGPLAEVALGPKPAQIQSVTLAWERQGGQWQLIRPSIVDGKMQVPPGNYRLYYCNLLGKAASGDQTAVTGIERTTRMPFSFGAGKVNKLECGGPLEVKVSATKVRANGDYGFFSENSSQGTPAVRISTQVIGKEGEVYSAYYTGAQLKTQPDKPTFTITDEAGKEVAHGSLEYG